MVSTTSSRSVSITETVSLLALATQTKRPSGDAASPEACGPTTISLSDRPCAGSTTETEPSEAMWVLRIDADRAAAARGTRRGRPAGDGVRPSCSRTAFPAAKTTSNGALPTGICRNTPPEAKSISATVLLMLSAAQKVLPCGSSASPAGTSLPDRPSGSGGSRIDRAGFNSPSASTANSWMKPLMLEANRLLPVAGENDAGEAAVEIGPPARRFAGHQGRSPALDREPKTPSQRPLGLMAKAVGRLAKAICCAQRREHLVGGHDDPLAVAVAQAEPVVILGSDGAALDRLPPVGSAAETSAMHASRIPIAAGLCIEVASVRHHSFLVVLGNNSPDVSLRRLCFSITENAIRNMSC